jgi:phage/plasmid-associated DNA primase
MTELHPAHLQKIRERGFSDDLITKLASQNGRPPILQSLTAEEIQRDWLKRFPSMRGNPGGALLLRFNDTTFSLKPDQPDWDEEHQRFTKYLYAWRGDQPKGSNTQPWLPSKPATIATEGLFDALIATALIGVPCAGATAPSHVLRSEFPKTVTVYVSDADVPYHHFTGLLPVVIGQCKAKKLKLAHLPRNPDADYAYTGDRIPEECKWGMEEWHREWLRQGLDPKQQLQQVISSAKEPYEYVRSIFLDYGLAGIRYPINNAVLVTGARAISDATDRRDQRLVLRDLLHSVTKAPKKWIDDQVERRDSARFQEEQKALEERIALGLEQPPEPYIPPPLDPYQIAEGRPVDVHLSNLLLSGDTLYGSAASSLYVYNDGAGYWLRIPQQDALHMVQKHAEQVFDVDRHGIQSYPYGTAAQVSSCLTSLIIKANNRRLAAPEPCIPFLDQTYDCRTGQPQPHSPDHGATYGIAAALRLDADCPDAFYKAIEICYGEEAIPIIRAWIRAIVDPTIPYGRFLLIVGQTGTGKGLLLEFLDSILPASCRSSLEEPGDICNADKVYQFVLGKRYISFHDLPARLKPMQLFYKLVENVEVSARKLNASDSTPIAPNCRFSAGTTKMPTLSDSNDGISRRALVLTTNSRDSKPDRNLKASIVGDTEQHRQLRAEVIGWALSMPKADVIDTLYGDAAADYLDANLRELEDGGDAVAYFIDEVLQPSEATEVTKADWALAYSVFRAYCETKGFSGKFNEGNFINRVRHKLPHLYRKRRKESLADAVADGRNKDSRRNLPSLDWGWSLRETAWGSARFSEGPRVVTAGLGSDGFEALREHRPACPGDSPQNEVDTLRQKSDSGSTESVTATGDAVSQGISSLLRGKGKEVEPHDASHMKNALSLHTFPREQPDPPQDPGHPETHPDDPLDPFDLLF